MANLSSQLKGLDIRKMKLSNGRTIGQTLHQEALRLKKCIQKRLDEYLNSYEPISYHNGTKQRTGALENSLMLDDIMNIKTIGNRLYIEIYFDESGNHKSGDGIIGWKGNGETANVASLLNYGYEVKKDVWFKDIENFGYREGGHFIEDGIADFNTSNPLGIKIDINRPTF